MAEKIEEIRIVNISCLSPQVRAEVEDQVAKKDTSFKVAFKGYAKMTYVTASPRRIKSIEPIKGSFSDYFKTIEKEGVEIPEF